MCGIVGYLGKQEAQGVLLDCLGRLEYRGYDSAGIATVSQGKLGVRRSVGKNADLHMLLGQTPLFGQLGIAHTRWATHGKPTDLNSHPHTDCSGSIAVVHNGIVEGYQEIREELELEGHLFSSQTDSEVIAHLIEANLFRGLEAAVMNALSIIKGSYAIAVISQQEPDKIIVARSGGIPLVIGHCDDGLFVSSDISAILHYTRDIQVLEDGEIAVVSSEGARILMFNGDPVDRARTQILWEQNSAEKGAYPHFMLKEIYEQPQAVTNTIQGQTLLANGEIEFPEAGFLAVVDVNLIECISIVACGSSWHAALAGKYLIESIAGTKVDVDIASEHRYRPKVDAHNKFIIGISQSGETADTLRALQEEKKSDTRILAICNVPGSSMCRESDGVIYTHAGPEIGVASTKTFTCQLTALALFAISLARAKGKISSEQSKSLLQSLKEIPAQIERVLKQGSMLTSLAQSFKESSNAIYLGRGALFPLAIEGALKLKEVSYIHAEGFPAGELKHGPIALIEKGTPVIVLATKGPFYEKNLSTIEEVKARGGQVIVMASESDNKLDKIADHIFYVPEVLEVFMPILMAVPLQLLSYYFALHRGCDVDKPRNLAKSVTVE